MQNPVAHALSSIILGDPVTFEKLTMIPLVGPPTVEEEPDYLTLDEALAQNWAEVTEVSEQGSVPELRVVNKGTKPLFILDGEELVGAKQNRVVNLTILVPAATTLTIPVSCVEAGRWRARSRAFTAAPRAQYASGRAKRMRQVTTSMRLNQSYHSDQTEVWADIAEKSERLAACSPTGAMEEMFIRHSRSIEEYVDAMRPVPCQVGALFLLEGRVVGFDLFDRAITLRRLLRKLVRSVAVDAIDRQFADSCRAGPPERSREQACREGALEFLTAVSRALVHIAPATGGGQDVRFEGGQIAGGALVTDAGPVHASAFVITQ
jgi:hypothetical protein